MKVREIRELNQEDVNIKIAETRKSILEMRFQLATRKLESPAKLRQARKQLARLLTIQTEQANTKADKASKTSTSSPEKKAKTASAKDATKIEEKVKS
jgi:large subunit ribosomal protein L29